MSFVACPDCKALVPDVEGPTHAYIGGSAGCWKIREGQFDWLEPPGAPYALTVVDVAKAQNPEEHEALVRRWALATWNAWEPHHGAIARLAEDL